MDVSDAKQERTYLEMAIENLIISYNKRTEARVTAVNIRYSYSSLAEEDRPDIDIEVNL